MTGETETRDVTGLIRTAELPTTRDTRTTRRRAAAGHGGKTGAHETISRRTCETCRRQTTDGSDGQLICFTTAVDCLVRLWRRNKSDWFGFYIFGNCKVGYLMERSVCTLFLMPLRAAIDKANWSHQNHARVSSVSQKTAVNPMGPCQKSNGATQSLICNIDSEAAS